MEVVLQNYIKHFTKWLVQKIKRKKKLSIIVTENKTTINQNSNSKKSKYITCPKCNDTARINLQNFKIKLYGCKERHIIDNLSVFNFNNNQLIDESKIICDISNTN